eukprot:CAMPEP_0196571506 /NCGR_PEP_ID=MMETSP1081-20130531/1667_1 /TAXON_ID=36882 /ORGANISM="Pyramimonas amylifera, Strain CCMP720" /LENGTH=260 /DNA_ID=CAMNT_0041888477 /DNA_START=496 /DNA_END=1275 /DNA_ORIENTATION=-
MKHLKCPLCRERAHNVTCTDFLSKHVQKNYGRNLYEHPWDEYKIWNWIELGGDPNLNLGGGLTALHVAALNGSYRYVNMIAGHRKTKLTALDDRRLTPLYYALVKPEEEWHFTQMAEMITENLQGKKNAKKFEFREERCIRNNKETAHKVWLKIQRKETVGMLTKRLPHLQLGGASGLSALHVASKLGDLITLSYILNLPNAPDVNSRDVFGCTPLYYAIAGSHGCTKMLLNQGALTSVTNLQSETPLQFARRINSSKSW